MEVGNEEVIISESSSDNDSDDDSCSTEPAMSYSPVASLLDRLKRPQLSDLARKRKRKVNPQPRAPHKSTSQQLLVGVLPAANQRASSQQIG